MSVVAATALAKTSKAVNLLDRGHYQKLMAVDPGTEQKGDRVLAYRLNSGPDFHAAAYVIVFWAPNEICSSIQFVYLISNAMQWLW